MLTRQKVDGMSNAQKDALSFRKLFEMYLGLCGMSEDEINQFFDSLTEADIEDFSKLINGNVINLKNYTRYMYFESAKWLKQHNPESQAIYKIERARRELYP